MSKKKKPFRNKNLTQVKTGDGSIGILGKVTDSNITHVTYQEIEPKQERPDLTRLFEVRKKGILLKDVGLQSRQKPISILWEGEVIEWDSELFDALSKIDKDKAKFVRLSENMVQDYPQPVSPYDVTHLATFTILTEMLKRLDKIIEEYLQLPSK